ACAANRLEQIQDVVWWLAVQVADRFDSLQREAAAEHAELSEQPLLAGVEELVTRINRCPQRLVAGGPVAPAAREECQAAFESAEQRGWRQQPYARRRQFERERQSVEPDANLGDGCGVGVGQLEIRSGGSRALGKQLYGLDLRNLSTGLSPMQVWN